MTDQPAPAHLSFLSRCCGGCGATVCVRCDDLAQAPAVAAAWDAEGWGYAPHPSSPAHLGGVRCPACMARGGPAEERPATVPKVRQPQADLFG